MSTTTEPVAPEDDAIMPDETPDEAVSPADETTTAETPDEPTQTPEGGKSEEKSDAESLPEADDKLKAWAESKGLTLDSDNAVKAAKIAMDNQAEFQRSRQKATSLQKAVEGTGTYSAGDNETINSLVAEVQGLKLTQNVNSFFADNPDAKAMEDKMAEIVQSSPDIGQMVKAGYMPLTHLYAMAKGMDSGREQELKAAGGKEALKKVASKQQAKAVHGAATNSDLAAPEEDPFLTAFEAN